MSDTPSVLLGGVGEDKEGDNVAAYAPSGYTDPEFILVDADPRHVWIDDIHLVETTNRRLQPGKYLLTVTGGKVLYEVIDVRDSDTFNEADVPDFVDDVEDPAEEVVLKTKYDLESEAHGSTTQSFPRYQYETEKPLTMGDSPPVIFNAHSE